MQETVASNMEPAELSRDSSKIASIADDSLTSMKDNATIDDKRTLVFVFTSCIVGSFLGGFHLHLILNRKKYNPDVIEINHAESMTMECPRRFAYRAFRLGSLISIIGTGSLVMASYYSWKM